MNKISTAFIKYHGNGNDFIVFDLTDEAHAPPYQVVHENARALCDRHLGIGGDGIITVQKRDAEWHITVVNADGSIAQNCGNGLRVAASHIARMHHVQGTLCIMFAAQAYECMILGEEIAVAMGICTIYNANDLLPPPFSLQFGRGQIGNSHLVFLVQDEEDCPILLAYLKDKLPTASDYNLGFVWFDQDDSWHSRVYERGVGFTQSCGTGAIVAAAFLKTHALTTADIVTIHQPGGALTVTAQIEEVRKDFASFRIVQQGKAAEVFSGICHLMNN